MHTCNKLEIFSILFWTLNQISLAKIFQYIVLISIHKKDWWYYLSLSLIRFSVKSYYLKIFVSSLQILDKYFFDFTCTWSIRKLSNLFSSQFSIAKTNLSIWKSIEKTELIEHFSSEFFWSCFFSLKMCSNFVLS